MSWWTDLSKPDAPKGRRFALTLAAISGTALGLALLAAGPVATACGPYFPYWIVTDPRAPLSAWNLVFEASLDGEVKSVVDDLDAVVEMQGYSRGERPDDDYGRTVEVERREIARALAASGRAVGETEAILGRLDAVRRALRPPEPEWIWGAPPEPAPSPPNAPPVPPELPAQYRLYLEGARAFRLGDPETAAEHFRAVLALPEAERRERTTWATFMLGRLAAAAGDSETALDHFAAVRARAAEGFPDPLGLAAASVGRAGGVELARGRYAQAIALYLDEYRADPEGPGYTNLRWAAAAALTADPATLARVAADPPSRRVVTAYLLSHDRRFAPAEPWLAALEAAEVDAVEEGGAFAWLAYQEGDFDQARRWIARATPADTGVEAAGPLARWVEAKLRLRDGDLAEGRALLETVDEPRARAEAGVVALSAEDFSGALGLFVAAGHAPDAGYVAEKVLTLDELTAFPIPAEAPQVIDFGYGGPPIPEMLRTVTSRRLARAGRLDAARDAHPGRPVQYDWLREWLAEAEDPSQPAARRADAYFHAAELTRLNGLALRGTLLGPDWGMFDGQFDLGYVAEDRARATGYTPESAQPWSLPASAAELERARAARPVPDHRWHYRYVAADLAWTGAHLLPVGDSDAARWLCTAGSWLADDDPAAADRYYKALVRRGGSHPLAREADRLRWFPADCEG